MDKTHKLLEGLKATIDPGAASNVINQSSASSPDNSLASSMDFLSSVAMSMIGNPLFYVKLLALLVLTVIIVMVSLSLITDG